MSTLIITLTSLIFANLGLLTLVACQCYRFHQLIDNLESKDAKLTDLFKSTKEYLAKVDFEQETMQDRFTYIDRKFERLEGR